MGVYREIWGSTGIGTDVAVRPRHVFSGTIAGNPLPLAAVVGRALVAPPGQEWQQLGAELTGNVRRELPDVVQETATGYALGVAGSRMTR